MPTKPTVSLRDDNPQERRYRPLNRRDWILVLALWMVSSLVLIGIDQARLFISREKALKYEEGELVEDDFRLDQDFSFIDQVATERVIELNRRLVPPVYTVSGEITDQVLQRFDRFSAQILSIAGGTQSSEAQRVLSMEFPGITEFAIRESIRKKGEIENLLKLSHTLLQSIMYGGIFRLDESDGGGASGVIEVVYPDISSGRRATLSRDAAVTQETLETRIRSLDDLQQIDPEEHEFIIDLVMYFCEPNAYFDLPMTEKSRSASEETTEPVVVHVPAGTRLLTAGNIVTGGQARVLEALKDARNIGYHNIFDPLLYMAILFALGIISARNLDISLDNRKTQRLYLVLAGSYLVLAALTVGFVRIPVWLNLAVVMPTALYTLLLAQLLQDRRLALLSSIFMAILLFFLSGGSGHVLLMSLTAGIGGALSVRYRENRIGLLKAGPRLAVLLTIGTFLTGILTRTPAGPLIRMSLWAGVNGLVTGILSLAFLPLLEHALNTATTFRLIELSDLNVPILRRMRLQAPGTYIHSQNVAHLAEAACDAIGADGLLARVGAYYHDIGKVDQAHFFVENQTGENRHDELKASLSVAVIKSHVRIGMEKGRELNLPDEVLAFIEQHHGTSVIRYFYDRAVREKGTEAANPDDYSYGGPRPLSREAAVVMLADSAEAATRALKKPTAAKLEKYVWDLIMDRFRSGELNDCDLTLRDLETVKESFVHVLTGHFHSRIEYPKENGTNR